MSRTKGTLSLPFNIEPEIAAPVDARFITATKADLTLASTWTANDGNIYAYKGMFVSVHSDPTASNNGIYQLLDADYTVASNWQQLGTGGSAGTPATTVTDETSLGVSPAVGTATEYARQDHTHGTPSNAAIKAGYEANPDTNAFTDAEKAKLSNQSGINTGDQDISGIAANATAISDHVGDTANPHGVTANQVGADVSGAATSAVSGHETTYDHSKIDLAYTHSTTAHAPSDAQKNSDITQPEIEAKLVGEVTTHTHPGGSGTTDHSALTSKEWSNAGHIIDTDVDFAGNSAIGLRDGVAPGEAVVVGQGLDAAALKLTRHDSTYEVDLFNFLDESLQRDITHYGAKGDIVFYRGAVNITAGTNSLLVDTAFSQGDVGKGIKITGAGATGLSYDHVTESMVSVTKALQSTITAVSVDGLTITLADNAITNVSEIDSFVEYFTDDTVAIQAAIDSLQNNYLPGIVKIPKGTFCIMAALIVWGCGIKIEGDVGGEDHYIRNPSGSKEEGQYSDPLSKNSDWCRLLWQGDDAATDGILDDTSTMLWVKRPYPPDTYVSPDKSVNQLLNGVCISGLTLFGCSLADTTIYPAVGLRITAATRSAFTNIHTRHFRQAHIQTDCIYQPYFGADRDLYGETGDVSLCEFSFLSNRADRSEGYGFYVRNEHHTPYGTQADFFGNICTHVQGPIVIEYSDHNIFTWCGPITYVASNKYFWKSIADETQYGIDGVLTGKITGCVGFEDLLISCGQVTFLDETLAGDTAEFYSYGINVKEQNELDYGSPNVIPASFPEEVYSREYPISEQTASTPSYNSAYIIYNSEKGANYNDKTRSYTKELELDSSTSVTINTNERKFFKITFTEATCTVTLTEPIFRGVGRFHLRLIDADTCTITWPSSVIWSTNTQPTWSGDDRVVLFWDGTNWVGSIEGSPWVYDKSTGYAGLGVAPSKMLDVEETNSSSIADKVVAKIKAILNSVSSSVSGVTALFVQASKDDDTNGTGTIESMRSVSRNTGAGDTEALVAYTAQVRQQGAGTCALGKGQEAQIYPIDGEITQAAGFNSVLNDGAGDVPVYIGYSVSGVSSTLGGTRTDAYALKCGDISVFSNPFCLHSGTSSVPSWHSGDFHFGGTANNGNVQLNSDGTSTFKGVITSTVTTGTAPLVVASTTKVANLSVETAAKVDGAEAIPLSSTSTSAKLEIGPQCYIQAVPSIGYSVAGNSLKAYALDGLQLDSGFGDIYLNGTALTATAEELNNSSRYFHSYIPTADQAITPTVGSEAHDVQFSATTIIDSCYTSLTSYELTIATAGAYEFSVNVRIQETSANADNFFVKLQRDTGGGYADVNVGSNAATSVNASGHGNIGFQILLDAVGSGDKFKVVVIRTGANTYKMKYKGCSFGAKKLR